MNTFSLKLEGMDKINEKIEQLAQVASKDVPLELKQIGVDLQAKAQEKAPNDLGDLRGSAFTVVSGEDLSKNTTVDKHPKSIRGQIPNSDRNQIIVGFTEPYAVRQHEDMTYKHDRRGEVVGGPKFLENAFKENKDKYIKDIESLIKKAVTK